MSNILFENSIRSSLIIALAVAVSACTAPGRSAAERLRQPTFVESVQDLTLFNTANEDSVVELSESDFKSGIQYDSIFYQTHKAYRETALAASRAGYNPAFHSMEANRLRNEASIQDRLPQVTSELSVADSRSTKARINIEQILIANGRFSARKRILNSREVQSVANYEIEINDQIAEALDSLINTVHQKRKMDAIGEFINLYEKFLQMADARVRGGVASRTEVRLFELKKAQAESERREYESEYIRHKVELESLTDTIYTDEQLDSLKNDPWLEQSVEPIEIDLDIHSTPRFKLARSEVQEKVGELEVEQASRRAQLSLIGSVGKEWSSNESVSNMDTDVHISFQYTRPLYWGKNLMVESIHHEVSAANTKLLKSRRDIEIAINLQTALLNSYLKQLDSQRNVVALAEGRSLNFAADFKAGAVTMAEAVSVLETAKSVKLDFLETLHAARSTEVDNARLLGLLGPFDKK